MDPTSGRFTARDPWESIFEEDELLAFDPVHLHEYTYSGADPLNRMDPGGEFSLPELSVTTAIQGILVAAALIPVAKKRFIDGQELGLADYLLVVLALTPGVAFAYRASVAARATRLAAQGATAGARRLLPAFAKTGVDKVLASSRQVIGGQGKTQGARAIAKKLGHAKKNGVVSAFEGSPATQQEAACVFA